MDALLPIPTMIIDRRTPAHIIRSEVRAAILSLVVGIVLMGVKFWAYYLTKSAVIFSDAMEGTVNVASAIFALYAIRLAHRPADKEHPYGHGKIEFLSGGLEGGMIVLTAILIAFRAAESFALRQAPLNLQQGLLLTGVGLIGNGAVGFYLLQRGRKSGSMTLEADGVHLLTDAVTSVAVLVALLGVRLTGLAWIDPVSALLVCAYITIQAASLMRRSAAGLMDEQDEDDEKLIRDILDTHALAGGKPPLICSYHKLRHRHSGRYHWVDFHIMVPPNWDIDRGHRVASAIEYEIEQSLGEGNATAHVEPCTDPACRACKSQFSSATTASFSGNR